MTTTRTARTALKRLDTEALSLIQMGLESISVVGSEKTHAALLEALDLIAAERAGIIKS